MRLAIFVVVLFILIWGVVAEAWLWIATRGQYFAVPLVMAVVVTACWSTFGWRGLARFNKWFKD